jgi:hypothetical protein
LRPWSYSNLSNASSTKIEIKPDDSSPQMATTTK